MNNDLISRSALLGQIGAAFLKTDPKGEEQLGYLACSSIVRGFPAVDAEPNWISVNDDVKPLHGKRYLCVCTLPDDPKHEWDWLMVLTYYYNESNGYVDRSHFTDEGVNGMTVTHWMPLPKLPKMDGDS